MEADTMKVTVAQVILVMAVAIPMINGQCVNFSTSFQFTSGDFFPAPNIFDYDLSSELFLGTGLAAIAEVQVNYSSAVPSGDALVTIEYQTSDTRAVGFTYDNETAGCSMPNSDVTCDLGKLGILQDLGSSSRKITPAMALVAIALYTQDLSSLLVAGALLAPRMVAAQTCTDRLVISLTFAEVEDTLSISAAVLTDSIQFQAACKNPRVSCGRNLLTGCRFCD